MRMLELVPMVLVQMVSFFCHVPSAQFSGVVYSDISLVVHPGLNSVVYFPPCIVERLHLFSVSGYLLAAQFRVQVKPGHRRESLFPVLDELLRY